MGFRFRKSFKIMPGVRLNLSKSGLSTSIGGKGITLNLSKRGVRSTTGIPGTGLSYSTLLTSNRRDQQQDDTPEPREERESSERASPDSASRAPLVWAIFTTLLLGWLLPTMSWWAYILIFVLMVGVFSSVASSDINQGQRTPRNTNELDIPPPERTLQTPSTSASTPDEIGEIIPSRNDNSIRATPQEPNRNFAIGVASAAVGATAVTLVLLPLMPWWVYLTVFPAVALSIILLVNWRMR